MVHYFYDTMLCEIEEIEQHSCYVGKAESVEKLKGWRMKKNQGINWRKQNSLSNIKYFLLSILYYNCGGKDWLWS